MNTGFNIGGESIKFVTSAEMVKYGSGNVKDALDNLKGVEMSDFGRQLYEADEDEFRRLLQLTREDFFDDGGQNRFVSNNGAYITDAVKRNNTNTLRMTTSSSLVSSNSLIFGGDPFEISFYAYFNSAPTGINFFRAIGTSKSFGLNYKRGSTSTTYTSYDVYCADLFAGTTSIAQIWNTESLSDANIVKVTTGKWIEFKLNYSGSALKYYINGTLKRTYSATVSREPRKLYFGPFDGYIDEFKLVDDGEEKVLLHFN